ncbi:NADH:ubiquinone reductase (Na(+)-transporting) subunit A [Putridiphycobacter roseus]|uniref:Na(+)-translocating NADH-quinone reductase subunit A n=1 Tax=Putridiphycobacter roseus TaxID=2219161 RepID=A0A2W1N2C9_9FLAO|nr:Na(+)-translocating NADH-quinone reductase subunit A [Putridiphycobacter roseus]PZE18447.1 NADH:ubiquinone reductase (Na(+)-transporting) subunit A [Putridiphycobacter roseus]
MSKTIKIRKGLDIKLKGAAEKVITTVDLNNNFIVNPTDFHGVMPKMVVKAGDKVNAGDVVFYNKNRVEVKFCSPVSGEVAEIVRGAKRKILAVRITADSDISYTPLPAIDLNTVDRKDAKSFLLNAGLWPFIKMRPLDVIANPEDNPKAIFISAFDSSPLAPDYDYLLHDEGESFQAGIDILKKMTDGKVHLTINSSAKADEVFKQAKGVQLNSINGMHPAGNVGTQIHHIDPINKGEVVWTVNALDVALIGRAIQSKKFDLSRVIAVCGSEVKAPKYSRAIIGAEVSPFLKNNVNEGDIRVISGNVLTGTKIEQNGHLGFYDAQITVIPEGNKAKFSFTEGWMEPGFKKFSVSRTYFSWLSPNKKHVIDTNTNGEERSFVVTGEMEKVFPFDILPMYLTKACMYHDLDEMENLGIYEVAPEDMALCEFVCTSKVNIQSVIREGLDEVRREIM